MCKEMKARVELPQSDSNCQKNESKRLTGIAFEKRQGGEGEGRQKAHPNYFVHTFTLD